MASIDNPAPTVIAVDIGTGSVRALLVDAGLRVLAQQSAPLELEEPQQGWAQQAAHPVVVGTFAVLRGLLARRPELGKTVSGLCFSNAVSSLLPVDRQGRPLHPALVWADTRSAAEAESLKASHGAVLYARTGCPVHATYWLPKLRWLRRYRPELFSAAAVWMTLKDYILYQLTGEILTDASNAAATGLLNLAERRWDGLALELAEVGPAQLPPIASTRQILPYLTAAAAAALDLPETTSVVLGAGDGVLSNLGAGAVRRGQATTMIGSSGACRTVACGPGGRDPLCRTWSYPLVDDLWILGGAENSGGLVVQWLLETVYAAGDRPEAEHERLLGQLIQEAAQVSPGSDGLLFLPYLFGERAPIWDADARGVFIGLSSRHGRPHLARAVLEGTVFALYSIFAALEEQAGPIEDLRASGGYARSPAWLQLQADLFGKGLSVPDNFEGSALGAAMLGHYALGHLPDLESAAAAITCSVQVHPDPLAADSYRKVIPLYTQAYSALRETFTALRALRPSA